MTIARDSVRDFVRAACEVLLLAGSRSDLDLASELAPQMPDDQEDLVRVVRLIRYLIKEGYLREHDAVLSVTDEAASCIVKDTKMSTEARARAQGQVDAFFERIAPLVDVLTKSKVGEIVRVDALVSEDDAMTVLRRARSFVPSYGPNGWGLDPAIRVPGALMRVLSVPLTWPWPAEPGDWDYKEPKRAPVLAASLVVGLNDHDAALALIRAAVQIDERTETPAVIERVASVFDDVVRQDDGIVVAERRLSRATFQNAVRAHRKELGIAHAKGKSRVKAVGVRRR